MDSWEGTQTDPLSLHKYLYADDDPVNRIDPSGHMSYGELGTVMTKIAYLGSRTYAAVNNAYWMSLVRVTPLIEKGMEAIFWADVALTTTIAGAEITSWALNTAADLSTKINKAYSLNTTPIPANPGQGSGGNIGYGYTIENIGGQQLEAMGGKYIGGNVKGIDGTVGVAQGNVLVSFKAHDLTDDGLLAAAKRDLRALSNLDPEAIKGTAVGGGAYQYEGAVQGRIVVIGVPQSQARYIISPQFINAMRQVAEETKTMPIVRAVRNWSGRPW